MVRELEGALTKLSGVLAGMGSLTLCEAAVASGAGVRILIFPVANKSHSKSQWQC